MGNVQKKCSACGEAQEPDAAFCTNCGQRLTQDSDVKKCSSCGASNKPEDAFCSDCGNRLDGTKPQVLDSSPIGKQLLALANDFLSVQETSPEQFEFSSETTAQSALQGVKIKYNALVQLEPQTKQMTFWEKMVESSVGMTAGVFAEKTFQKGIDVSKKVHGQLLFGGKYGFEYGKLREVVKTIAGEQGWNFKTAIFKPEMNTNTKNKASRKSIPMLKIILPVLALLLIAVIGITSYLYFSGRSKSTPSQTTLVNSDQENADKAGGKSLIETDKNIYHYGEKISVNYYNAPGYSRDWICIVPADSRNTAVGDYQYIPRRGQGVMIFESPQPGRYEVRAFYKYSPGRYKVSARYGFTVENR
jgi:hypothetical protein